MKRTEYDVSEEEQPDKAWNTQAERIENQPVEEKQTTQREKVTEIIKGRERQIAEPKQELSPQIIPDTHKVKSSSQPILQGDSQDLRLMNETNHDHPPMPQTTSSQPPPSSTVSPSLQVSAAATLPLPLTLPSPIYSPVVKQPLTKSLSLPLSPTQLLTSPQSVPNFASSRRSPITSFTGAPTVSSAYSSSSSTSSVAAASSSSLSLTLSPSTLSPSAATPPPVTQSASLHNTSSTLSSLSSSQSISLPVSSSQISPLIPSPSFDYEIIATYPQKDKWQKTGGFICQRQVPFSRIPVRQKTSRHTPLGLRVSRQQAVRKIFFFFFFF